MQEVCRKFSVECGKSVEDFLDSIYFSSAKLAGTEIEHHVKCIVRSRQMSALLDSAVQLLHTKHKKGEACYWILYHTFRSPHRLRNVDEILDKLCLHIQDISYRTYYRKRVKKPVNLHFIHKSKRSVRA